MRQRSPLKFFAVFSAITWKFNLKFYRFIYRLHYGELGSTVVKSPASEATGLRFESRWRQIISVRGSDGIRKYLPYFSSYLMLIMRELVVSVCIN